MAEEIEKSLKYFSQWCGSTRDGFCLMVNLLFNGRDEAYFTQSDGISLKTFSELWSKRPPNDPYLWFSNTKESWGKRYEMVKQCIKETEPK